MTREEMGALLGMTLLIDTEELLDTLWAKADALEKAGEPLGGDRHSILEGHASIWGMWCDLHDYAAGRPVDFIERIAPFDDSAEVAGWLAEMGNEEEVKAFEAGEYYEQTYESAAQCLLTLYGLMALAAAAQAEEANADRDNEEALA